MGVFLADSQRRTCRVKWFVFRDDIRARKVAIAESTSLTETQYETMKRGLNLLYGAAFRLCEIAENDGDVSRSFRELFEKLTEFNDHRDFGPSQDCLVDINANVAVPLTEEVIRIFAEARIRF
mgnify:CR=1 FL=1